VNTSFKYKLLGWYCIIFYALLMYKWYNGLLLYQIQPSFFYTREDIFTWVFMQTGLHQWLLNNANGWLLLDGLFYSAPLFLLAHTRYHPNQTFMAAGSMLLINLVYVQCYTLYPTNSVEGHIAWLLFPVVFMAGNEKTVVLLFDGLRYFFLFFFVSAGIWKLAQGGAFNSLQMTGILLEQHKEMLMNSPGYWQTKLISYVIDHARLGYLLYLLATLIELSFIAGFFTRKYDKILALLFLLFLVMDHLLMRITYYEVLPLLLTLYIRPSKLKAILL